MLDSQASTPSSPEITCSVASLIMPPVCFAVGWYVLGVVQSEAILAAFHGGVKGQGDGRGVALPAIVTRLSAAGFGAPAAEPYRVSHDLARLLRRSRRTTDPGYLYRKQAYNARTASFLIMSGAFCLWKYQGSTDDKIRACPIVTQDAVRYRILMRSRLEVDCAYARPGI